MKFMALLLGSLFLAGLIGCYSFSATNLPSHIQSIQIKDVENQTNDAMLGIHIKDGIVEMFRRNASGIRQVNEDANADIQVTLVSYTNTPENFSRGADVETYKATVTVNVLFRDLVKNTVIYEARALKADGIYDVAKNESEELHGQKRAIEKLQDLIINNALAKW